MGHYRKLIRNFIGFMTDQRGWNSFARRQSACDC